MAGKTLFQIVSIGVKLIHKGERLNLIPLKEKVGGVLNTMVSQWKVLADFKGSGGQCDQAIILCAS